MARPATGEVLERCGKRGTTFAIRFTLPGGARRQVRLGRESEGWTRRRAEEELQAVLADLRRGRSNVIAEPPEEKPDPLFAVFAHEWFESFRAQLRPNTVLDYEWQVTRHLLPAFGPLPLSAITIEEVDRYRQAKVREGVLAATSINKTLTRLAQILEVAVEYGHIARNPARGKRRRLKAPKYRGTFLDGADAIAALLGGAAALDREGSRWRRALLALLVFGGLRIGEALSLRWRDVNLPSRTLRIVDSKTDAGYREVDLLPALVDELVEMRARSGGAPSELVFATSTGARHSQSNIRKRLMLPAIERANGLLEAAGRPPLPEPMTPHSLRRTFISILLTLGEPVPYVMEQAGHEDPAVTLGIYARVMRRSEQDKARLRTLIDGGTLPAVPARFGADQPGDTADRTEAATA